MDKPWPEAQGSLIPKTNVNLAEAEALCQGLGGRLPTSEEYDLLFQARPWPYINYEWTSTEQGGDRIVRGGSWDGVVPALLRASARDGNAPTYRYSYLGFRCVKLIDDDMWVPKGWTQIP